MVGLLVLTAAARWWRSALPTGADTEVHLLRAVELDWALRHGYLYPRWAPDLVFGFGYPLFNVYGLGAQVVIVALHALGLSFLSATLLSFALADLLGALGALVLARSLWNDTAGLLAAAAYAYAPYVLGSLYRGSLPEALALGLLPWLLWSLYRLWRAAAKHAGPSMRPGAAETRWVMVAAGLYALLPLLHAPTAVLASVLVGAGLTAAASSSALAGWREPHTRRALGLAAGALCLGLLLSAFYWLPVVFEARYLQLERGYRANVLNFHFNFLDWRELLAWPRAFDPKLIGVSAPRSLGWPQLMLGGLGLATWRWQPAKRRPWLAGLAAGVMVLALLTLPLSLWVWEHAPGLGLLQFPARLLGPASLLLALLGGAAGSVLERAALAKWQGLLVGVATAAILVFGLPWTFQHTDPAQPANPTLADIHAFERRTGTIGTTTAGEYLPRWVTEVPPAERLANRYAAGAPPARLDPASLPAGSQVLDQTPGLVRQAVTVSAPAAFEAVFDVFYFPGWQARVDGQPAPIRITAPHGLVSVPVPAGTHAVEIFFGTTPPRVIGGGLAAVGLAGALGLAGMGRGRAAPSAARPARPAATPAAVGAACAAVAVLVFKLGVADRGPTLFARTRFDGAAVAGVQTPLALNFGGQMELLGYDLSEAEVTSGSTMAAALYWRVLAPLDTDYSVSLVLLDSEGRRYAQSDALHPAGFPTSRWPVDAYGLDAHRLTSPPGTPPGTYRLAAHLYRFPELAALTPSLDLGAVTITRPARAAELQPPQALDTAFGPIELLGAALGQAEVGAGSDLPLTLYWRSLAAPGRDYQAQVALLSPDGQVAVQQALAPVRADYPTSQWAAGETLLAQRAWHVPAAMPGGVYTVTVGLTDGKQALGPAAAVGMVRVIEPDRLWTIPPLAHPLGVRFDEVAELVGWELREGQLTLVWRARATPARSYSVFVHVRTPDGAIYSQRDAPPLGGTRPTTSWLAGEVLVDTYTLDIPPGEFSLAVGLYDPLTGVRVALAGGDDLLVLGP